MPFDGTDHINPALQKMDQAIAILADENNWCQNHLHDAAGRRCIVGVLQDIGAKDLLTNPILGAIKEVTGKTYHDRIEQFNDDAYTTHGLVLKVLHQARENILFGRVSPPAQRSSLLRSLHRLFA